MPWKQPLGQWHKSTGLPFSALSTSGMSLLTSSPFCFRIFSHEHPAQPCVQVDSRSSESYGHQRQPLANGNMRVTAQTSFCRVDVCTRHSVCSWSEAQNRASLPTAATYTVLLPCLTLPTPAHPFPLILSPK